MFKFTINKRAEESVGVDLGGHSIKIVAIKRIQEKPVVSAYNYKTLPSKPDKSFSISNFIKEAFNEVDLHPETVNISVEGPSVIVRFISLPKMKFEEIRNVITYEAERFIPFNINDVFVDYAVLGEVPSTGEMNIILAVCKKDLINERVQVFKKIGMQVNVVDVVSIAAFNALMASKSIPSDTCVALLDLGYFEANLTVVDKGVPRFMRTVPIGGKDIAKAIAEENGISEEKAEEEKLSGENTKIIVDKPTYTVLDDLLKEVLLSFDYFEDKHATRIKEVYSAGGLVYQKEVMDYFNKKFGVKVKTCNPLSGLGFDANISKEGMESVASRFAVSLGLALR
ncbi:MAG: type IV pilus assembly protein PilM [Candidatus Omnitrophica bacterium]|nr:type IV pilus assembly protein PilM [Candidatus Omnitrophota bacterium]